MRALGGGHELRRLRRGIGIDHTGQTRRDTQHRLAGRGGDGEHLAVQGQRPGLAFGRCALQRDDGRGGRILGKRRGLGQERGLEAPRAAPHQDYLGAIDDHGEVVARRRRDPQGQRRGNVGNRFAGAHGVRNGARQAVVIDPDSPGGTDHRGALQCQQRHAGGAGKAALVGIDNEQLGQREAVARAIHQHQGGAVGTGRVVGRSEDVDGPGQACRRGAGGLHVIGRLARQQGITGLALGHYLVGDHGGQVVANQGHGKGLADDQHRRQRGHTHQGPRAGLHQLARGQDTDAGAKLRAGALHQHELGAEGKGGEHILCVGIDGRRQAGRHLVQGLRGLGGGRIVVGVHQLHHVLHRGV